VKYVSVYSTNVSDAVSAALLAELTKARADAETYRQQLAEARVKKNDSDPEQVQVG
jgi:post-segregation antitoxin (ccd killing protein)